MPKYSNSYDFQTTHKEQHTLQGQDKHWRNCEIETFQMMHLTLIG